MTAPYLPSPWGRPVVVLAMAGGLGCGLVAFYRLFIAFMAGLGLLRGVVPSRVKARLDPSGRNDVS
ncbi:hypothetical protein [Streptomyces sp. NPDC046985]|uniref:hypothetical protein n=1 Tax=Streptomyces sp. NPDC046985 TaxID=3155377 RepID=UPI003400EEF8